MNIALREELLAIPVPMQSPGQPARAAVSLTDEGWRLYWLLGNLRREHFGPTFTGMREATAMSRLLNERNAIR